MVRFRIFHFSKRRLLLFLLTGCFFAAAIALLNRVPYFDHFWDGFYSESNIGTYFCEKTFMDKIIRQPINTFSNFIYWMAALAILRRGWKDQSKRNRYNIISANPVYSILYGVILLYTFSASTFFHSSLIHVASRLDFSAVYSLALFPLMYFTHRIWLHRLCLPSNAYHPRSLRTLSVVFSVLYLLFTFCIPNGWDDYVVLALIVLMVGMGIAVERQEAGKTNHRYLITCIVFIAIAILWFAFDKYKILCDPMSLWQPHSLWHLFAGASAFYFYMYIRSERNPPKSGDALPSSRC